MVSHGSCLWSKNNKSCGSQACLHVKNSTEREKVTNETRDFEPMQSVALPCVQWE